MKRFQAFEYDTIFGDTGYVIQEKKWWGWSNFKKYYLSSKQKCLDDIKKLEDKGYWVDNYIK